MSDLSNTSLIIDCVGGLATVIFGVISIVALARGRSDKQKDATEAAIVAVRNDLNDHKLSDTRLQTELVTKVDGLTDRFDRLLLRLPSINV
jgi:hypothetical protein